MTEQQQTSLKDKVKDRAENGANVPVKRTEGKVTFSTFINQDAVVKKITQMTKDSKRFISAITSAIGTTPALMECDFGSILSAAFLGEGLNLSPSPQLGQYYLVPFDDTKTGKKMAVFVLGYKGFIQLATRSGFYKKINVIAIKEGELKHFDVLNEEIECVLIEDFQAREAAKTIGYYAMFEYVNGFKKAIYWPKEKMEAHAEKYSAGYKNDKKKGYNYTYWSKDFDNMAYKTMLRQLISKWGIMSIELEDAFIKDTAIERENGKYDYVDNVEDIDLSAPTVEAEIVQ